MAVWRELRRAGAVPIAQGVWAVPDTPAFQASVTRADELTRAGGGVLAIYAITPRDERARSLVVDAFAAARRDEWAEFSADCTKLEAEISAEITKRKFTFGELEEEEQSLDRLRRWFRDLKRRDVLALAEADEAEALLRRCEVVVNDFAELVYEAMRASPPRPDPQIS